MPRRIEWSAPRALLVARASVVALVGLLSANGCSLDERELGGVNPLLAREAGTVVCAECPELACPADDVCKDYAERLPAGTCSEGGACASAGDCEFSWKPAAREGDACQCDDEGCRLLAGEACTRADDCSSGSCVATDGGDNVCCAAACGPNEVCSPDGSACAPATPCEDGQTRCTGATFQVCADTVWETATECGALGCSLTQGGCLRSAGQACESSEDCGEGSCLPTAEGNLVCCTGACDETCRRCGDEGTSCVDADDDEACGAIACPSDECRIYDPPSVTTNRCVAGRCATPEEVCTEFSPQRADLECSPTSLCDGEGNCSRPKKALLEACSVGPECGSGACVATLSGESACCASACTANEVCNAAGECEPAPVCDNGDTQCSGSTFRRCVNGQWQTVLECGALGCSVARGGCLGGPGDACTTSADCGAGTCQQTSGGGSVCCTAACDGACRRCAPSGTSCENLPDDPACGIIACPNDTTCRDFPPNVSTNRCVAGRCGSQAQLCVGTARAVGQSCSATNLCDNAGNCSAPKKALGAACSNGSECAQGNCVQGICCNSACNGVCSTCAGTGLCRAPATDTRCATGLCASPGVCQAPSVACGSETCPISGGVCCSELNAAGETRLFCQRGGEACPAPPAVIPDIPIDCDQHADCPSNRVCCMAGTNVTAEVGCKLPNPSPGTDENSIDLDSCDPLHPMLFGNQLCRSPAGNFACPPFESCTFTTDRLPGFAFCRPG